MVRKQKPLVRGTQTAKSASLNYQATMDDYVSHVGVVELSKKIAWSIGSSRSIPYGRHTEIGTMSRKIAEEIVETLEKWKTEVAR